MSNIRQHINAAIYKKGGIKMIREAISSFDKILKADPHDAEALFCKGYAYCKLGRYGTAVECFDKCIQFGSDLKYVNYAKFYKGYALKELRRNLDASIALGKFFGESDKNNPFYKEALCNKGVVLKELGRYDDSLEYFSKAAVDLLESRFCITHSDTYQIIKKLEELEYVVFKDIESAKIEFCLYNIGYLLIENTKDKEESLMAANILQKCIDSNRSRNCGSTNDTYALAKLSEAIGRLESENKRLFLTNFKSNIGLFTDGIPQAAEKEKTLDVESNSPMEDTKEIQSIHDDYFDGNGLRLWGNNLAAVDCFDKLLEKGHGKDKNNERKQKRKHKDIYALFFKACALNGREKHLQALECLKECRQLAPQDRDIIFNIGYTYRQLGQNMEAIRKFDKCLELAKDEERIDMDALMNKGSALNELGQYREALKCFEAYKKQREEELKEKWQNMHGEETAEVLSDEVLFKSEYLFNSIGTAYNGLKEYGKALVALEHALAINPENEYANINKAYTLMSINERSDTMNYVDLDDITEEKGKVFCDECESPCDFCAGCKKIKKAEAEEVKKDSDINNIGELYKSAKDSFSKCLNECKQPSNCKRKIYSIINFEYATIRWIEKKTKAQYIAENTRKQGNTEEEIATGKAEKVNYIKLWRFFREGKYGNIKNRPDIKLNDSEKATLEELKEVKIRKYEQCNNIFNENIKTNKSNEDSYFNLASLFIKKSRLEDAPKLMLESALTNINEYFNCYKVNKRRSENKDRNKKRRIEAILIKIFLLGYLRIGIHKDKIYMPNEEQTLHSYLKEYREKIQGVDTVALLGLFDKDKGTEAEVTIKALLDYDDFFINILNEHDNAKNFDELVHGYKFNQHGLLKKLEKKDKRITTRDVYKGIYVKSLEIIRLLHVDIECESNVAHYTRKEIAHQLIFDPKSLFRLSPVTTLNDPKEGLTLLNYLDIRYKHRNVSYQSFVGCFTFDHDSLNQFRLYGKESSREATGLSLVVNKSFFREEMRNPVNTMFVKYTSQLPEKYALFRCLYVNPETGDVEDFGRRGASTFLNKTNFNGEKEKKKEKEEQITKARINDYKEILSERLESVKSRFSELHQLITTYHEYLSDAILCELLLQLRYLVKHKAFKEEQECRIVDILPLVNNENVIDDEGKGSMYITYLNIREHTQRINFAPKAEGFLYFKDKLQRKGYTEIKCRQSKHPFTTR